MLSILFKKICNSKVFLILLFSIFGGFVLTTVFPALSSRQTFDPDYYFHTAFSRETPLNLQSPTIPQAPLLGWQQRYVDKEYLFHLITRATIQLGGEPALKRLPFIFLFFLITLLSSSALLNQPRYCSRDQKLLSLLTGASAAALVLSDWNLFRRLTLVRAYTFAIPLAILMVALLDYLQAQKDLTKNKFTYAALYTTGITFALGYHAIYLPLAFSVIAVISGSFKNRVLLFGGAFLIFGVLTGIFLHPNTHAYSDLILQHVLVALNSSHQASGTMKLDYGIEVLRISPLETIKMHAIPFLFWVTALVLYSTKKSRFSVSLISSTLCWLLAFISPRAIEFAIPLTALHYALYLRNATEMHRSLHQTLAAIPIFIFAVSALGQFQNGFFDVQVQPHFTYARDTKKVLESIPVDRSADKRALVFNCQMFSGSYIYYFRPDLAFASALDPRFLADQSPTLSKLRLELLRCDKNDACQNKDWRKELKKAGANYVHCNHALQSLGEPMLMTETIWLYKL